MCGAGCVVVRESPHFATHNRRRARTYPKLPCSPFANTNPTNLTTSLKMMKGSSMRLIAAVVLVALVCASMPQEAAAQDLKETLMKLYLYQQFAPMAQQYTAGMPSYFPMMAGKYMFGRKLLADGFEVEA